MPCVDVVNDIDIGLVSSPWNILGGGLLLLRKDLLLLERVYQLLLLLLNGLH